MNKKDAVKQVEAAVAAGKETVENAVKVGQDAAQKGINEAVAMTKDNADKASKAFFTGYDDLTEVSQGNIEAVTAAMNIWTKGFEAMGHEVASFTQGSFEQSVAVGKDLMACKTVNEVVDLQNTLARANFDKTVAEATKLSEMSVKTANEASEPLQARVNETIEKLVKPIAA